MRKRILSMLLTLTLALGLCAVPAQAAEVPMMEPSVETSFVEIASDTFYVLKSNGELWYYTVDRSPYRPLTTEYKRELTNVAAVVSMSPYDYGLLVLQPDGSLLRYDRSTKTTEWMGSNVRKIKSPNDSSICYLTAGGDLYAHKFTYTYDPVHGMSGYTMQNAELVSSNVLDFVDETIYVTGDHVLHYDGKTKRGFQSVSKHRYSYFALADNGDLYAWGNNDYGQVGNGGRFDNGYAPPAMGGDEAYTDIWVTVSDPEKILANVTEMYSDTDCIYARDTRGTLWQWGDAPEGAKVPVRDGKYYSASETIMPDAYYCSPRISSTTEPVQDRFGYYLIHKADGTMYTDLRDDYSSEYGATVEWKLPFVWSEIMGANGAAEAPSQPTNPGKPTVSGFTDVPATAYYADAVKWAVENGITAGTTTTTFSPNQTCSRAQIMTFLWRAAGCPEPEAGMVHSDVPAGKYYTDACRWAYDIGIAGPGNFWPNDPCTRAIAVIFIWNAANHPEITPDCPFTDVPQDEFISGVINWAVEQGITSGTSATTFAPNEVCTRAQIVTFLYRAFAE